MPMPGQARQFTRGRAEAVVAALVAQARQAGLLRPALPGASLHADAIDEADFCLRVHVRAWGCSRPRVWCYGQEGMVMRPGANHWMPMSVLARKLLSAWLWFNSRPPGSAL